MKEADRQKLIKLMGMLGSSFEGERANAAALATKLLQAYKLTWSEFVEKYMGQEPSPKPRQEEPGSPWPRPRRSKPRSYRAYSNLVEMVKYIVANAKYLSKWEVSFMESIADELDSGARILTPKQMTVLERIHNKIKTFNEI